tara:strand:- start:88 stop:441 length:354 start_codon:yes stop_codon:yes gene_type:complete
MILQCLIGLIVTISPNQIAVVPDGGVAPFTYQWSNGMSNDTLFNIPSGLYGVTVTDSLGCIVQYFDNVPDGVTTVPNLVTKENEPYIVCNIFGQIVSDDYVGLVIMSNRKIKYKNGK